MLSAEVNNYSIRDLHNSSCISYEKRDGKKPNSITKLFNGMLLKRGTGSGERGTGNGSLGTSCQRKPP